MNLFNDAGKPIDEIEDVCSELEEIVREALNSYVDRGCSAVDLRAAGGLFASCVNLWPSMAILDLNERKRKKKIAESDPNLSPEEIALVATDRIAAIKAYRDRTGNGLRESKEAVDAYAKAKEG